MTNKNEPRPLANYVQPTKAAQMLGVSKNRIYEYIRDQRLPAEKMGKGFFILIKDIEQFKANPSGRTRSKPPSWHVYKSGGKVLLTEIHVQVRTGQQAQLTQKLQAIQDSDQHTFPGTIARYIAKEDTELTSIKIVLVWKSTEMPDEPTRQQHLAAFQAALADVLNWETARIEANDVIIHT